MDEQRAFASATREGRRADLQHLTQAAQDVEIYKFKMDVALEVAISAGEVGVVRWLLQQGASASPQTL